jgi:DNA modification methylase
MGKKLENIVESLRQLAVPLGKIKLDPTNTRKHPEANLDSIKASLRVYGQRKPIVVNKRNDIIEAGNGTYEAAKALGWTHLAVVYVDDDPKAAAGFSIADNRTAELAEWDEEALGQAMRDLEGIDDELAAMVADLAKDEGIELDDGEPKDAEPQIDRAAELQKKWGTELGQLWLIGEHRLLCGDNAGDGNLDELFGDEQATLLFTDPPYGVGVGAKNRLLNSIQKAGRCLTDIEDDDLPPDDLKETLLRSFNAVHDFLADNCSVFVCSPSGGGLSMMMMMMMMQEACLPTRHIMIWKKNAPTFSMGRLDYDYQHEPILFAWKKTHKRNKAGPHQSSIWEVDKPRASAEHPTMKPIELPANAILNHTDQGDIVADIFLGSGTTMVAAQNLSRRCFGLEISPAYCAVILERMHTAFPDLEIRQDGPTKQKANGKKVKSSAA